MVTRVLLVFSMFFAYNAAFPVHQNMDTPCFALPEVQKDGSIRNRCIHDRLIPWQQYQVITFVSSNCSNCDAQADAFNQLARTMDYVATARMLLSSNSPSKMWKFISQHSNDRRYNISMDKNSNATRAFQIRVFPTTVILNRYDRVCYIKEGVLTNDDISEILQRVMQKL